MKFAYELANFEYVRAQRRSLVDRGKDVELGRLSGVVWVCPGADRTSYDLYRMPGWPYRVNQGLGRISNDIPIYPETSIS